MIAVTISYYLLIALETFLFLCCQSIKAQDFGIQRQFQRKNRLSGPNPRQVFVLSTVVAIIIMIHSLFTMMMVVALTIISFAYYRRIISQRYDSRRLKIGALVWVKGLYGLTVALLLRGIFFIQSLHAFNAAVFVTVGLLCFKIRLNHLIKMMLFETTFICFLEGHFIGIPILGMSLNIDSVIDERRAVDYLLEIIKFN